MAINFKKSVSDPFPQDIGNKVAQNRTVSKTLQFNLFTTNRNAVWAANQQIKKESYPFALLSILLNRNLFRLEVGDPFKLNYAKYGIVGMICRVLLVEEQSLESEDIIVHVVEDVFSVANSITTYTAPVNSTGTPPSSAPIAFTIQNIHDEKFPRKGTVITFAEVHVPPAGFESYGPYTIAIIELMSCVIIPRRFN